MPEPQPLRDPTRRKAKQPKKLPPSKRPKPATRTQLYMALMALDPLAQETMIAQRLASMPANRDGGMPVNIPRMVRGPWAHNLRKLGIFVIPELATHELVSASFESAGQLVNHAGAEMKPVTLDSIWARFKQMNPSMAADIDAALETDDPGRRKALMAKLYERLPADHKLLAQRLMRTNPDDLAPR